MESFRSISRLVRSVRVEANYIDIEFCSDCGELQQTISVEREASLDSPPRKSLARFFRSTLRRALGYTDETAQLTQEEKESATCRAFEQLKPRLRSSNGQWVRSTKNQHPGEYFDSQLRANPIVEKYDVDVLVRVLLEVSRSDSELRTEERTFLEEIVQDESTIKRLSKAPKITVAELAETSSLSVKETILMLAWAMAYADGHLDNEEMLRLNQLCRGFMLPEKRVRELQMAAKLFLMDRHFQNLKDELALPELRADFEKKAQEWGLDEQQLQTLRSWYPVELS
jgi:tellurite resistance protein